MVPTSQAESSPQGFSKHGNEPCAFNAVEIRKTHITQPYYTDIFLTVSIVTNIPHSRMTQAQQAVLKGIYRIRHLTEDGALSYLEVKNTDSNIPSVGTGYLDVANDKQKVILLPPYRYASLSEVLFCYLSG